MKQTYQKQLKGNMTSINDISHTKIATNLQRLNPNMPNIQNKQSSRSGGKASVTTSSKFISPVGPVGMNIIQNYNNNFISA